eukprot:CAMPEP_0174311008 /NCGR_PEP_ID=MMETSP0810-20121108/3430_1 /TAXON_ID=73025 ORGANISM="Eutreptiella gymnastica-like, Strain CCMP1594" /NCGR_SAMPLE_ID=MMETSP0810 /ASSEMBLY_ACC=CAM_ASM_000659 /LENGTH=100 /DNA_ID=CAMNT_0015419111 /DNA_START=566 /DNA_END=865 /DNA_ORIENTATION=-
MGQGTAGTEHHLTAGFYQPEMQHFLSLHSLFPNDPLADQSVLASRVQETSCSHLTDTLAPRWAPTAACGPEDASFEPPPDSIRGQPDGTSSRQCAVVFRW